MAVIRDFVLTEIGAFANAGLTHDIARLKAIKGESSVVLTFSYYALNCDKWILNPFNNFSITEMEGPVNLGSFTVIQSGGRLKEIFDNNDGTSRGKNIAGVTIFKENVDHTIEMRGAKSNK